MSSPTRGLIRGLRACSLGVGGFVLALIAHVAAHGVVPRSPALLLLGGLTGLAALLLTGVRLSPVRVGLSLIVMQVTLHEAFMQLSTTGMADAGMGQRSPSADMAMVGAHVAATTLMATVLAAGEKVLWFLAGLVTPIRWPRLELAEPFAVSVIPSAQTRSLRARFADGGVGRRGPPRQGLPAPLNQ
ncbi:MAG: hypothetical protein ABI903_03395 [Actinomycetota bacterium]